MPRRRRRAAAAASEAGSARGLALRLVLKSPKDTIAGLLAFSATTAIVTNALFLQTGPHPAPMFGSFAPSISSTASLASPLPRPRPAEADSAESKLAEPKLPEPRIAETKAGDPLANLVRTTTGSVSSANVMRPSASIPLGSHSEGNSAAAAVRRIAAVQRALTEYGYGQLKPTGTAGADTQAAIQKFERERKLPVTGQISDRMVHELAVVIGHPVD
jgi:putative peptidoglycan binding protein